MDLEKYCEENKFECVRSFLDCRDYDGNLANTCLTIAAKNNNLELLEILLTCYTSGYLFDINTTSDTHRWTPLIFACAHGNHDIVSRLLKVPGLDINYEDEDGDTAAHLACYDGSYSGIRIQCVRILAETGRVDWNKRNQAGQTPLYLALFRGHSKIADIIMEEPDIDYSVKTEDGKTLGHAAVTGGNEKCVETLAAQEIFDGWNVPDNDGDTPVMMTLKGGIEYLVEILLGCPRVDLDAVSLEEEETYDHKKELLRTARSERI